MKKINFKKMIISLGLLTLIAISTWSLILAYRSIDEAEKTSTIANEASIMASKAKEQQIDLPSIIDYWKPQIAHVVCSNENKSKSGSGTIFICLRWNPKSGFVAVTNKHLLIDVGFNAKFCEVEIGEDTYKVSRNRIILLEEYDMALISIDDPTENTKKVAFSSYEDAKYCNRGVGEVGNEVIIIGYPGIGTIDDMTVTKGIISGHEERTTPGQEGYYFVTDAKIDYGNSGGAAILLERNCYLGIPTGTIGGEYESLGRILDIMKILIPEDI